MGQTGISLRHRLLLFTEVYRDTVISAACLGVFTLVAIGYVAQMEANPVVAMQRITGVIESIRVPIDPNGSAGRALHYTYDVRLDDNRRLYSSTTMLEHPIPWARRSFSNASTTRATPTPTDCSMGDVPSPRLRGEGGCEATG